MTTINTSIPTEAEVVARAHAMIPWLREKADAVEKARMVPDETIQAFKDAGFFFFLIRFFTDFRLYLRMSHFLLFV